MSYAIMSKCFRFTKTRISHNIFFPIIAIITVTYMTPFCVDSAPGKEIATNALSALPYTTAL